VGADSRCTNYKLNNSLAKRKTSQQTQRKAEMGNQPNKPVGTNTEN
jgi:hypothetical protein